MVELSKDMLDSYRINLYKSLVFKDVTEELPYILDCLEKDRKEGTMKKLQEIVEDGKLLTAYYQLPQLKTTKRSTGSSSSKWVRRTAPPLFISKAI